LSKSSNSFQQNFLNQTSEKPPKKLKQFKEEKKNGQKKKPRSKGIEVTLGKKTKKLS